MFIPSSWPAGLDNDIIQAFSVAYREFIMRTMYIELQKRASEIINPLERAPTKVKKQDIITLTDTPEFVDLQNYVEALSELEKNIRAYNGLGTAGAGALNHLAQTVKYLFGIELPQNFYSNSEYYLEAISRIDTPGIDPLVYKREATTRTEFLVEKLFARLFEANPISISLDSLVQQLQNLEYQGRDPANNERLVREIIGTIKFVETALEEIRPGPGIQAHLLPGDGLRPGYDHPLPAPVSWGRNWETEFSRTAARDSRSTGKNCSAAGPL